MILYDIIEKAIQKHENIVVAKQASPSDVRNAVRWVMRNNPSIFWFAHQYHFDEKAGVVQFQYTFSKERTESIRQSIEDVIQNDFCLEYVKALKKQEQVAYVYKWLVTYCNYNVNSAYNQSIYSVFVRRNSVCTGYAKSAQYLFDLLGIESRLVFGRLHNDKEDGRHCWNLVKIDDQYYHFDVCFGDRILDGAARKSGVKELFKIDSINYNFLCVSTNEILKTRSIEDITALPESSYSWPKSLIKSLVSIELKQREGMKGCLLSHIGNSADIYLCAKEKHTVLKVFRSNSGMQALLEYHFMQQTKGCKHLLQCNEQYTCLSQYMIAIELSTPIVDLLCSHYYELSLKGLIKMASDVAAAWKECQEQGVLYRDIHIGNIYRSNNGTFKLGDFGSCTNDFDAKEAVGNQWFMAPEAIVSGIFTEASAVYSISMIMYFILNNLRPAFWKSGHEDVAMQNRINGYELPTPTECINLPHHIKLELDKFFRNAFASLPEERIDSITKFIHELNRLANCCRDSDYIVHCKGANWELDLNAGNNDRLEAYRNYSFRYTYQRYTGGDKLEQMSTTGAPSPKSNVRKCEEGHVWDANIFGDRCPYCLPDNIKSSNEIDNSTLNHSANISDGSTCHRRSLYMDEVEGFAHTNAPSFDPPSNLRSSPNMVENVETYATTGCFFRSCGETYSPQIPTPDLGGVPIGNAPQAVMTLPSILGGIVGFFKKSKKHTDQLKGMYSEVYSSIFAPAEVKRKSHMQIQVYLHLYEETERIISLAKESDKNAERRDYIPLSLKLRRGDKVDVELNIYGESRLMSERKSIIWQGSFTKCSFDYFVPKNIDVDELSCEANLFVNGVMIGEMRFITQIVEIPRTLNPEILSHRFNRIFISYAHQDASKIRLIALAYKAQGVDYFYDRDSLKPGDVYGEKIFDYIDKSDLFVLCWSKNAAVSDYVAKEKGHALLRAYPQLSHKDATLKICPVSIEPRAELPSDMKEVYNFEVI